MALGAMAKYPGLDVKIIPVGLNYFNGHRFRSRAYVDMGAPMTINPQHVLEYVLFNASSSELLLLSIPTLSTCC
jgi:glycerol-3-phosphate O-acyltransferase/dihydroxyacetone phosphate acyltransferase